MNSEIDNLKNFLNENNFSIIGENSEKILVETDNYCSELEDYFNKNFPNNRLDINEKIHTHPFSISLISKEEERFLSGTPNGKISIIYGLFK